LKGRLDPAEWKLYSLIWERFVASQMAPAKVEQRMVTIMPEDRPGQAHTYEFHASASEVKFPGYMKVWNREVSVGPDGEPKEKEEPLPALQEGEPLECVEWLTERKETKPPPRFTEASLVRTLERNEIGRPSTYAQILSTLTQRQYVDRKKQTLFPTDLGMRVNELLVSTLDKLFDVKFTASMEEKLDAVERGELEWAHMIGDFYTQFKEWMLAAREPAADMTLVAAVLAALEPVEDWAPPVKRGKRTYSDEQFVESIKRQIEQSDRPVSDRQLQVLLRMAGKYAGSLSAVQEILKAKGLQAQIDKLQESAPKEATLKKLSIAEDLDLDESTRKFVTSLRTWTDRGRALSDAQTAALNRVLEGYAEQIPDFDTLREEFGLSKTERSEDEESKLLLAAMATVKEWKEPVTKGKRVFDDKAFYDSLSSHFSKKKMLSPRQKAALKKMVKRYREAIPDFEKMAGKLGLDGERKVKEQDM
jgi:hypothetical protein